MKPEVDLQPGRQEQAQDEEKLRREGRRLDRRLQILEVGHVPPRELLSDLLFDEIERLRAVERLEVEQTVADGDLQILVLRPGQHARPGDLREIRSADHDHEIILLTAEPRFAQRFEVALIAFADDDHDDIDLLGGPEASVDLRQARIQRRQVRDQYAKGQEAVDAVAVVDAGIGRQAPLEPLRRAFAPQDGIRVALDVVRVLVLDRGRFADSNGFPALRRRRARRVASVVIDVLVVRAVRVPLHVAVPAAFAGTVAIAGVAFLMALALLMLAFPGAFRNRLTDVVTVALVAVAALRLAFGFRDDHAAPDLRVGGPVMQRDVVPDDDQENHDAFMHQELLPGDAALAEQQPGQAERNRQKQQEEEVHFDLRLGKKG